jgi:hypothetical protein
LRGILSPAAGRAHLGPLSGAPEEEVGVLAPAGFVSGVPKGDIVPARSAELSLSRECSQYAILPYLHSFCISQ